MSARTLSLTVSTEQEGRRVRSLLQGPLGLSAGLVTRLKQREGAVRLNGRPVRTLDAVRAGDLLEVDVGDVREGVFVPGGVALAGQIGVGVGLALLLVISVANLHKEGAK